jgi:prephenate dehydrogenase
MSSVSSPENTESPVIERGVAILGPGLLGGSIAFALTERLGFRHVSLWGRNPTFIEALNQRGWRGQSTTDLAEALDQASLVILATPVGVMPDLALRVVEIGVADDCLITDVGSVKQPVVEALSGLLRCAGRGFVGSHPMAGSERTGIAAADPMLFEGAPCIVTPTADHDESIVARLSRFWNALGCRVQTMSAIRHDQLVARVSHLPHLLAALLMTRVVDGEDPSVLASVAGPGFRDTTRVAAGDATMWSEILMENRDALTPLLQGLQHQVGTVLEMLQRMDEVALRSMLEQAGACRRERFTFPHSHA